MVRFMLAACLLSPGLPPVAFAHAELAPGEGFVEVPGGKAWYRVYAGEGQGTPLLVLHGGRSERPDDVSLWTLERAVEELATVRRALGLQRVIAKHEAAGMRGHGVWHGRLPDDVGPVRVQRHRIDAPVLFVTGHYDEAQPETVAEFQRLTPGSQFVIVADATHMVMLEQPAAFETAVRTFLRQVDADEAAAGR